MDYHFNPEKYQRELLEIFTALTKAELAGKLPDQGRPALRYIQQILREHSKDGVDLFSRDELIAGYKYLSSQDLVKDDPKLIDLIKMKPVRTGSGVTVITVLTKPFPCPGNCIFCPNDVRMPKSYIASEPGAQRAGRNAFDPYLQTYNRLLALTNIGHQVSKVELIVLGGTWSFYPLDYRIWFIKRCFDALNDFGTKDNRPDKEGIDFKIPESESAGVKNYNAEVQLLDKEVKTESATWEELAQVQELNSQAKCRNVGLVLETRPDYITETEILNLRRFGATKVQIGVQSLDDEILKLNRRGINVAQIARSFKLLREAGFKIHAHWMPNLYGSSVEMDKNDYLRLWAPEFCPDELKIYPTSVITGTVLSKYFHEGKYHPYTTAELEDVLSYCLLHTPRYCRLTRIVRDIPSQEIETGNKITNLRQIVELKLIKAGTPCQCIRCREIRQKQITRDDLKTDDIDYKVSFGSEHFLSLQTKTGGKIAGFLRLNLPKLTEAEKNYVPELRDCALIREVHVYGQMLAVGTKHTNETQHLGIGKELLSKAEKMAQDKGFRKIAVISAIGTRRYYQKFGYQMDGLYQVKELSPLV